MSPTPAARGASRRDLAARLALPVVLLAALALRLHDLGSRSVWTDEGGTWAAAMSTFGGMVRICLQSDPSPPFYYLLTSLALKLGDGEAQLRLVPALASVLLVWVTYRFARLVAGRGEATLAAALLGISPFQLMFAQEARAYMQVALFTVTALFLFARAVLLDRRRAWLPFITVSALALWSQNIALLGVGVQAVVVLLSPQARRRLLPWLGAQAVACATYLPWFVASLPETGRLAGSHWYLSVPGPHGVLQVARAVFLSPVPLVSVAAGATVPGLATWLPRPFAWALLVAALAVPLARTVVRLPAPPPHGPVLRLFVAGLLLPPLAVLAVSPWMPLWLPRFFVLLSPMAMILLAHGLVRLRPRALVVVWSALLFAIYAFGAVRYDRDYTKEDWRGVVRHIATVSPPGRTAALVLFDIDPFAFYARRQAGRMVAFEFSHPDVPVPAHFSPRQLDEAEATARRETAGYDEVWVVLRSLTSESRHQMAERAGRVAIEGRALIEDGMFPSSGGPVYAARYRRVPRAAAAAR